MDSIPTVSKSKAKRLKRKAKLDRVASDLAKERKLRVSIEKTTRTWRERALTYKNKLNHEERAKLAQLSTRKSSLQRSFAQLTGASSSHRTITKATPSLPDTHQRLSTVPVLSEGLLQSDTSTDNILGSGRFGHCTRMTYKDIFTVCVKKIDSSVSWSAVRSEAAILYSLNTGDSTPHCFGACSSLHSIVMSYIHVKDEPMTLYTMLHKRQDPDSGICDKQCTGILVGVCKGLSFIHGQGYLHNDIKLDNIVLGTTRTGALKPYIIDFGKARRIGHGKMYTLSDNERQRFKEEHAHIAPDLRDGLVPQSVSTDIYSYGRVIKQCNSLVIRSVKLKDFSRIILSYNSSDRPQLDSILRVLTQD